MGGVGGVRGAREQRDCYQLLLSLSWQCHAQQGHKCQGCHREVGLCTGGIRRCAKDISFYWAPLQKQLISSSHWRSAAWGPPAMKKQHALGCQKNPVLLSARGAALRAWDGSTGCERSEQELWSRVGNICGNKVVVTDVCAHVCTINAKQFMSVV